MNRSLVSTTGVKKSEVLFSQHAMVVNKPATNKWFEDYEEMLTMLGIKHLSARILNCDDTGMVAHSERPKL